MTRRQTPLTAATTVPETLAAFAGPDQLLGTPDFSVDYLGVSWSGPRPGGMVRFRHAAGWGQWSATACPGDAFYPDLPAVRQDVADLLSRAQR